MTGKDSISGRQAVAAGFVAVLSPLIRRFPRVLAATAGRTAWLSAAFTALPAAAVIAAVYFLYRRQSAPTGFGTLLEKSLGRVVGRAVTLLYTLWILFYAGFLLRSGAGRFISTVYPGAAPWLFVVTMALLCGCAAMGRLAPIARAAMIFRPLLIAVFALAALLTLKDIDFGLLVPVTAADLLPNGCAALQTANVLSIALYLLFLGDRTEARLRLRELLPWLAALLFIIGAMTACCIGMFGPELTAKLTFPFFMLVRDVTLLGSLERIEPVVIALWVFSDFILLSLLLTIAGHNLRSCFGRGAGNGRPLSGGRWLSLVCIAAAAAVGLTVAPDLRTFELLSETLVPLVNAVFVFALPIPAAVIGLIRRRI